MIRTVKQMQRKEIAENQNYKCANNPNSTTKLYGLDSYACPCWTDKKRQGTFDKSGYEVDHIIEWSISHDDNDSNLQALCPACHNVKTNNFIKEQHSISKKINSDIDIKLKQLQHCEFYMIYKKLHKFTN